MITYIIKVILCSAVFLFAYKLLFEKERMHRFKRIYLLSGLALSFVIPVITFSFSSPALLISENQILNINIPEIIGMPQAALTSEQSTDYIYPVSVSVYVTITMILFLRFIVNLRKIFSKLRTHEALPYKNSEIILIDDDLAPHSFLNHMFINRKEFRNGNISPEILMHEYAHIEQKHSYDILFTELLQVIFWFNPFFFLYRKAIQLNHEFLADESVIDISNNISGYQNLLIENASKGGSNLTRRFNYSITKKRLVMLTKTRSFTNALCRQIALVPILALAIVVFSIKSFAQVPVVVPKSKQMTTPSTQEGVSRELLNEYEQIVNKAKNEKGRPDYHKFSDGDISRLQTIYLAMSKEQQKNQIVQFMPKAPPAPKIVPTEAQIESWKNSEMYGVWIDNKRINNSELDKYRNTDFAQVFVSYVHKNARNFGPHHYQVNLMTIEGYKAYYKKAIESKNKYLMGIVYEKPVY